MPCLYQATRMRCILLKDSNKVFQSTSPEKRKSHAIMNSKRVQSQSSMQRGWGGCITRTTPAGTLQSSVCEIPYLFWVEPPCTGHERQYPILGQGPGKDLFHFLVWNYDITKTIHRKVHHQGKGDVRGMPRDFDFDFTLPLRKKSFLRSSDLSLGKFSIPLFFFALFSQRNVATNNCFLTMIICDR